MIFRQPKAYSAVKKKFPSKSAISLDGKIVQVGGFSSTKKYNAVMQQLLKQYPKAKEDDFVFTFIFGKHPYIV